MTETEFAEAVNWIDAHWGPSKAWTEWKVVYPDFAEIPAEVLWECLNARVEGDPQKARFAPPPAELIALSLDRYRQNLPTAPELPQDADSSEDRSWRAWRSALGYDDMSFDEALRRRHGALKACMDEKCSVRRTPPNEHNHCHIRDCDIHVLIV